MLTPTALPPSSLDDAVRGELAAIFGDDLDLSAGERLAYATDCWTLGFVRRQAGRVPRLPDAVCRARRVEQVQALLRLAQARGLPVVPYGGGSGVCGGTVPVEGGVALCLKPMNRLLAVRDAALLCEVEAGMVGQHLEDALNRRGYTAGHFPSSIACSTVGGWLAARSSGQASTRYGSIEDICAGLELVLADGRLATIGPFPRSAAGPDWRHVILGSEGTLGVITKAWLRVWPLPEARRFCCFRFGSVSAGLGAIRRVLRRGYRPAVVRLYDPLDTLAGVSGGRHGDGALARLGEGAVEAAKGQLLRHPRWARVLERFAGGCHAVFVCEGDRPQTELEAEVVAAEAEAVGAEDRGPDPARHWYEHRYDISFKGASVFQQGGFVDTMELAATWDRIEPLYDAVGAALRRHAVTLAHFSHAYPDGVSVYFSFAAVPKTPEQGEALYQRIWDDGLRAAHEAGGTVTHHHGVGILKARWMEREVGPLMDALRGVKAALDPGGVLNPGKLGLGISQARGAAERG